MVQAQVQLILTPLGPENSPLIRFKLNAPDPYAVETLDQMSYWYIDPVLGFQLLLRRES